MSSTAAVKSLVALSDMLDIPVKKSRRSNFFGPWIPHEKWSIRGENASALLRKRRSRTPKNVSKKATYRISGGPEDVNPTGTPMNGERSQRNTGENGSDFQDQRSSITRGSRNSRRPNSLLDKRDDNDISTENSRNLSSSQRSSLPALITMTSDTNSHNMTFGLGKQLDMNPTKLLISRRGSSPRDSENGPNVSSLFITEERKTGGYDTDDLSAVLNVPSDALQRALAKRKPTPAYLDYDDISIHMKHYRMYHTILGTGAFSLANRDDTESDVKTVQWNELFPDQPLTATASVTEVPVFRFSIHDFQKTLSATISPYYSSYRPRPRTPVIEGISVSPQMTSNVLKSTNQDSLSNAKHIHANSADKVKSAKRHTMAKIGVAKVIDNHSDANMHKTVGRCVRYDKVRAHYVITDDDITDYKTYLKTQKTRSGVSALQARNSEESHKNSIPLRRQEDTARNSVSREKQNLRRAPILSPVREPKDGVVIEEDRYDPEGQRAMDNAQEGRNREDKNGDKYSALFHQRRVIATRAMHPRNYTKIPKLVVNAQRLRESVIEKIEKGERIFERSYLDKCQMTENSYARYVAETADTAHVSDGKDDAAVNQESVEDSNDKSGESDTEDGNNLSRHPLSVKANGEIGVVTAYDFKNYVKALRLEAKAREESDNDINLVVQSKSMHSSSLEVRTSTVRNKAASLMTTDKQWCPSDSRIPSGLRRSRSDLERNNCSVRTVTSAEFRYKPTSSAFVIAAPPTSYSFDKRSVVLPLDQFMRLAMGGREKSFSEISRSMNNASSTGLSFSSRSGAGSKLREDGLLRVVSFATPVNQFIFAKRVTSQNADNLGAVSGSPWQMQREPDHYNSSRAPTRKYRLKLSDFIVRRKGKTKAEHPTGNTTAVSSGSNDPPSMETTEVQNATGNINLEDKRLSEGEQASLCYSELNLTNTPPSQERRQSDVTSDAPPSEKLFWQRRRTNSLDDTAHSCLRQELLRLLEKRRARSALADYAERLLESNPQDVNKLVALAQSKSYIESQSPSKSQTSVKINLSNGQSVSEPGAKISVRTSLADLSMTNEEGQKDKRSPRDKRVSPIKLTLRELQAKTKEAVPNRKMAHSPVSRKSENETGSGKVDVKPSCDYNTSPMLFISGEDHTSETTTSYNTEQPLPRHKYIQTLHMEGEKSPIETCEVDLKASCSMTAALHLNSCELQTEELLPNLHRPSSGEVCPPLFRRNGTEDAVIHTKSSNDGSKPIISMSSLEHDTDGNQSVVQRQESHLEDSSTSEQETPTATDNYRRQKSLLKGFHKRAARSKTVRFAEDVIFKDNA